MQSVERIRVRLFVGPLRLRFSTSAQRALVPVAEDLDTSDLTADEDRYAPRGRWREQQGDGVCVGVVFAPCAEAMHCDLALVYPELVQHRFHGSSLGVRLTDDVETLVCLLGLPDALD